MKTEPIPSFLNPPAGTVDAVLDTDTYNEIDDQFAVTYALLSPERIRLRALYAAPFHNHRSEGPGDGMEKSYEEIQRLLGLMNLPAAPPVYRGSEAWLPDRETPVDSPTAEDLIARAREDREGPLYVIAIGALTNVAAALLKAPDIKERIVVLWLGGQPTFWETAHEFNLQGDWNASRFLFDCGVPLIYFPCNLVSEALRTTLPEVEAGLRHGGTLADYLVRIFRDFPDWDLTVPGSSKVIWDLAPVAWLVNARWTRVLPVPSPVLSTEFRWSHDPARPFIGEARYLERDGLFKDLFHKLGSKE